jgi:two-component system, response regulator YesN
MYKVLLVDDEPWALIGIRKSFNWEENGFEIIAETTDPIEALEIIFEQRPDVVCADIRMPEITGIELMKKVREANIESEFIIISGFAEFEYARDSIRFGGFDYLLKPLEIEELHRVLTRLNKHLKKKKVLLDIDLYEKLRDKDDEIDQLLSSRGLKMNHKYYQVFAFSGNVEPTIIRTIFHELNHLILTVGKDKYFVIINTNEDAEEYLRENNRIESYSLLLSVGVSSLSKNITNIVQLMEDSDVALQSLFIYSIPGVYRRQPTPNFQCVKSLCERIFYFIDTKDKIGLNAILKGAPEYFKENNAGMYEITYFWNQIVVFMNNKHNENQHKYDLSFMDYYQIVQKFSDISSLCNHLIDLELQDISPQTIHLHFNPNENFMELLEYVDDHFNQELKLNHLANQFFLHHTYVCELFKKVTNNTFSEYVTHLRMKKASELLKYKDLAISDVSQKVGFKDYYYFSKVFKKYYGQTPTKYRKMVLSYG